MDISALMKTVQVAREFDALAVSPLINGDVKLRIGESALIVCALFDEFEILFTEINKLSFAEFVIIVKTERGNFAFSRMGCWCQKLYEELCAAYNKEVLRSWQINDSPLQIAQGDYCYIEGDIKNNGSATFLVYDNCVVLCTPDICSRCIPLGLVRAVDKSADEVTIRLISGESYIFSELGNNCESLVAMLQLQIHKLHERSQVFFAELDPSLSAEQAEQIALLMPLGTAAPIGQLMALAPSFIAAAEEKIAASGICAMYLAYKKLCDPLKIWLGYKDELMWLIVPAPNGQFAALEFIPQAPAASISTLVYRTAGDFDICAVQLIRALETVDYKREVLCLSDEELRKPENSSYYLATKRNTALQFVRANFAGLVLHSGTERWNRNLLELWSLSAGIASAKVEGTVRFAGVF